MKEQCFLVREDRRARGLTVLRRDKTEVSRGGGRRWWIQEDGSQMSWKNDFEMSWRLECKELCLAENSAYE